MCINIVGSNDVRELPMQQITQKPPSMIINPQLEEQSHQKNLTIVTGSFEVIIKRIRQQFRKYVGSSAGLDKQLGEMSLLLLV